ncbi:MAG TPA: ParB/RepB/Spo0J family partition protein [Patescibacteria group bacterium]|nr:ParB/RepB/Spo0J family partition protein [Patescibacteria group bacterium]
MSAKKQALGRGFDSLIPSDLLDESFDPTASQDHKVSDLRTVSITEIHANPDQPRQHFDQVALDELAASVAEHGVIQPIIITPRNGGGYVIVAGERRWRAATAAGLEKIPAIVRSLSAQHKLELSLIENLQREQLNVMETATAYLKLRDQFNLTIEQIGKRVGGKSQSAISNTMRLLKLPQAIKQALSNGDLTEGQARPLVNVEESIALELLPKIVQENWSARRIEAAIAGLKKGTATKETLVSQQPVVYEQAARVFEKRLATKVSVKTSKRGSGSITIAFKNEEDFKRIQHLLES